MLVWTYPDPGKLYEMNICTVIVAALQHVEERVSGMSCNCNFKIIWQAIALLQCINVLYFM